jgi:hypothetical protein
VYFEAVEPVIGGDVAQARASAAATIAGLQKAMVALTGLPG